MSEPITYEIVFRGRATERLLTRLRDDFAIESTADGFTRLVGDVRDPAQLHGVIAQLTSFAIEIVSLAPAGARPSSTSSTSAKEAP
ncbi:MAG: hypothetical protein AAGC53_09240 [Actinomycetota bacterium]